MQLNGKEVTPADILRIAGVAEPKRKITIGETRKVGPWTITFDPPPIPNRCFDWQYRHDDYDGADDSLDNRHGHCATFEECLGEIIEFKAEQCAELEKRIHDYLNALKKIRCGALIDQTLK